MKAFINLFELRSGDWRLAVNIPRQFQGKAKTFRNRHAARDEAARVEDTLLRHGYDPVIRYKSAA